MPRTPRSEPIKGQGNAATEETPLQVVTGDDDGRPQEHRCCVKPQKICWMTPNPTLDTGGCCIKVVRDIKWAVPITHDMCIMYSLGFCYPDAKWEELYDGWPCLIKYDPFYWFCWICMFVLIVLGKWFHAIFGQGWKVRPDEYPHEEMIRVMWVYTCDGMYAAFFVLDIFYAANAIMTDADFWSQGGAGGVYQYIYAIFLYLGFLGGNIMLLNGMKNKNQGRVRVTVIGMWCFFIMLLSCWIYVRISHAGLEPPLWSFANTINFLLRLAFIIILAMASVSYSLLWNIYINKKTVENANAAGNAFRHSRDITQDIASLGDSVQDVDGDDMISKDEWLAGGRSEEEFLKLDVDNSGFIERHERKFNCCACLLGTWPLILFFGVSMVMGYCHPDALFAAMAG